MRLLIQELEAAEKNSRAGQHQSLFLIDPRRGSPSSPAQIVRAGMGLDAPLDVVANRRFWIRRKA